jgi:hypothetical protein
MRFPARPGSWALAASWMAAAGPAPPAHVARAVWVHGGGQANGYRFLFTPLCTLSHFLPKMQVLIAG